MLTRLAAAALVAATGAAASAGASAGAPYGRVHSRDDLSVELLRGVALGAVQQLLTFYNESSGEFGPSSATPYWTTANAVEALANYAAQTGDASVLPLLSRAHDKFLPTRKDAWRDDAQWYLLAFARLSEVTGNTTYLETAQGIFYNITGPWSAWNLTCGGIGWEYKNPYVNTITNTLFLSSATLLWDVTHNTTLQANFTYRGWAQAELDWFTGTPLWTPSNGLIIDGLDTQDCSKTTGAYWTYNQGVILSGLTRYAAIFNEPSRLADAATLAKTAVQYYGASTPRGDVLVETACGAEGMCGGLDVQQFKGVFVRHLAYALPAITKADAASGAYLASALLDNAASLLANATQADPATGLPQFGPLWQGPFQPPGGKPNQFPFVAQGSGLDVVLAALSVLQAREGAAPARLRGSAVA